MAILKKTAELPLPHPSPPPIKNKMIWGSQSTSLLPYWPYTERVDRYNAAKRIASHSLIEVHWMPVIQDKKFRTKNLFYHQTFSFPSFIPYAKWGSPIVWPLYSGFRPRPVSYKNMKNQPSRSLSLTSKKKHDNIATPQSANKSKGKLGGSYNTKFIFLM